MTTCCGMFYDLRPPVLSAVRTSGSFAIAANERVDWYDVLGRLGEHFGLMTFPTTARTVFFSGGRKTSFKIYRNCC